MPGSIAEAYVQIIPTTKGIASGIGKELEGAGKGAGKTAGSGFLGAFKKIIAAAGIGKIVKDAMSAGGDIQQSFGGLETIYEDAASAAKNYAKAAASAGISANSYAEQAVSFGAALKQAYGGDTLSAMEAANTAILDMADNSAKMGTDIGSIQAAYQGFAKQNYTMLDNLKLGYGGTKTEMERLLADATKLSGIEYNIDNLGDVYDAIHVIQEDLGLTGVAAEEAKTTLTGSFSAMKASLTNFLADLALGNDVKASLNQLSQSIVIFAQNALPMIINIIGAAPQAIVGLVSSLAPSLLSSGIDAVMQLAAGIEAAMPGLLSSVQTLIPQITNMIATATPQLIAAGTQLILGLASGFAEAVPGIVAMIPGLISTIAGGISASVGTISSAAIKLFNGITNAIPAVIPQVVAAIPEFITSITTTLAGMAGDLFAAAGELMAALASGLVEALPQIIAAVPQIIQAIGEGLVAAWPSLSQAGMQMVQAVATGINGAKAVISSVASTLWEPIKNKAIEVWNSIAAFISNVWKTIKNAVTVGVMAVGSVLSAAWQIITLPFQLIWENCKDVVLPIWDAIVDGVSSALAAISSTISSVWTAIVGFVSPILNTLRSAFQTAWSAITSTVSSAITSVSSKISSGLSAAKSAASSILSGLSSSFSSIFNGIKGVVSPVVNWLKGIFNFSWSLPHIALPHFSISGKFSMSPPSVPRLSVAWYAKGAVLTGATIFGMSGDSLLGGGEAGPEAVAPVDILQGYIREAVGDGATADQAFSRMDELIDTVQKLSDKLDNMRLYLNGDRLVGGITDRMDNALGDLRSRMERGIA